MPSPEYTCPGKKFCDIDIKRIETAFSMSEIKKTKGKSMRKGYTVFRVNEAALKRVGITINNGEGRCTSCPIEIYCKKEVSAGLNQIKNTLGNKK